MTLERFAASRCVPRLLTPNGGFSWLWTRRFIVIVIINLWRCNRPALHGSSDQSIACGAKPCTCAFVPYSFLLTHGCFYERMRNIYAGFYLPPQPVFIYPLVPPVPTAKRFFFQPPLPLFPTAPTTPQVEALLSRAMEKRSVGCTALNEQSSRSHMVFTLRIDGTNASSQLKVGGSGRVGSALCWVC